MEARFQSKGWHVAHPTNLDQAPYVACSPMGFKSLSKISSAFGTHFLTEKCTVNKLWVLYARILVEVDITHELKKKIIIKDCEGRRMAQPMEYEWKLMFCEKRQKVGHKCGTTKSKMQWRPRTKPPEEEKQVSLEYSGDATLD